MESTRIVKFFQPDQQRRDIPVSPQLAARVDLLDGGVVRLQLVSLNAAGAAQLVPTALALLPKRKRGPRGGGAEPGKQRPR
jgi:hypothetical protein